MDKKKNMILNKERTMSVETSLDNIMAADEIVRDTYSPYGLVIGYSFYVYTHYKDKNGTREVYNVRYLTRGFLNEFIDCTHSNYRSLMSMEGPDAMPLGLTVYVYAHIENQVEDILLGNFNFNLKDK